MIRDYWAVLVAAGEGTRLGGAVRKAAIPVAGRPLACYSLATMMAHRCCRGAILVVHRDDLGEAADWVHQAAVDRSRVEIVAGGKQRRQSVVAGLAAISAISTDLVAIHDVARPALHGEDLEAVLQRASDQGAAILAQRVTDTLHRADSDDLWHSGVDRTSLWQAQTPQVFDLETLRDALQGATGIATDEAEAVARSGQPVRFVAANHANPKLTTAADVPWIEALLGR
ncbi:MAG: 2-C-methyl-D-erythritol 4-phosphate cytidylyltransferase [Planctomycetota bacterium]|nr:2-C-methyl-D-erythritol 4-phosphate cytidylyltransferase [Planctomycetota bacterium]